METTATALIGVIGGILVCLLSLLIALILDIKKDLRCTKTSMSERVKETDCTKRNDDVWADIKALQKQVWSGNHEK
jgi:hypothetical protein